MQILTKIVILKQYLIREKGRKGTGLENLTVFSVPHISYYRVMHFFVSRLIWLK